MNSIMFKTSDQMSKYIIDNYLNDAKHVIIPSGSTPQNLYNHIAKDFDHSKITYYGLDEWQGVSKQTIGSCYQMIEQDFLSEISGEYNFVGFDGQSKFEDQVTKYNHIASQVDIDLVILGVGLNGHIGLNEQTSKVTDVIIETELDPITKQVANSKYFTEDTKIEYGVTFSLDYILKAKQVIVMLNTENKKDILKVIHESNDQTIPAVYLKQFANVKYLVLEELYE